jgi:ABC-type histidine transport system ATPase subunit
MEKLVVKDLHKSYGSHEVLKGISLKAKAGDVISIIGSSGSGKVPSCAASTSWKNPTPAASA